MSKLRRLRCSFCGKDETEVAKLVAGPRVYICDECVAVASRIMENNPDDDNQTPRRRAELSLWHKVSARARNFLHRRDDVRRALRAV